MSESAMWVSIGAAVVVALIGGLITVLIGRRSVAWATTLAPLVAVFSMAAGVLMGARQMLFDEHRQGVLLLVVAATIPVSLGVGVVLANQTRRTARRRAAEVAEQRRLVTAEQARREVVSWMSHDLRTPLGGIRAMAESLLDNVSADRDGYLRRIVIEADRTSLMVDDLLALTRLNSPGTQSAVEQVDVADVVSDAVATLRPLAEEAGVTLSGESNGSAVIKGDTGQIARAVSNLLVNAVAASAANGEHGHVRAQVAVVDSTVRVEVQDTCGGIPEADQPRLFDAGWRGVSARTPEARRGGAGAGLGLAIVTAVAESHGGSVSVASRAGDGCTFTLSLPRA